MSDSAKGGKRLMSCDFESEPTMFDWPAKIKTRKVLVSGSAFVELAHWAATGTSSRAARSVMACFIVFPLPVVYFCKSSMASANALPICAKIFALPK